MTAILIIIGIGVLVFFRNDWKKTVYLLIFMVPFFGFIQLKILHLTPVAALIHDITIILPMYFLFILNRMKKKYNQFYLPNNFKTFLLFFIIVIFVFAANPFYETSLLVRLVGLKIWIFYLLFIVIGFEFIDNELELKKFCNFFAIVAIIPCAIGIFQYLGSYFINYRETMTAFYSGNYVLANLSTQGFVIFNWGSGVMLYRLPSTFSFAAQFNVYTVCAFVPAFTSVVLSKTYNEKLFYSMIVVLLILAAYASGIRSTTIYILMYLIFLILVQTKFYKSLICFVFAFLIIGTINLQSLPILHSIVSNVTEQSTLNIYSYGVFSDYSYIFENWFFGAGVGTATPEARHLTIGGFGQFADPRLGRLGQIAGFHEGFYAKVIKELGILGVIIVTGVFIVIIYEIFLSHKLLKNNKTSLYCSAVLALFLIAAIMSAKHTSFFTKYPSSFLIYFFIGIAIKLRFLNIDNEEKNTT